MSSARQAVTAALLAGALAGCANSPFGSSGPFSGSSPQYGAPQQYGSASPQYGGNQYGAINPPVTTNPNAGVAVGSAGGGAATGAQANALPAARPAPAGAALSSLIGNQIGAALDDDDRERAYAAQMQALEKGSSGAPVSWRNPDSGRYGTVVPGPAYQQGAANCRQYTHTIYIDGRPQTARGAACRNPDGTWTPIS